MRNGPRRSKFSLSISHLSLFVSVASNDSFWCFPAFRLKRIKDVWLETFSSTNNKGKNNDITACVKFEDIDPKTKYSFNRFKNQMSQKKSRLIRKILEGKAEDILWKMSAVPPTFLSLDTPTHEIVFKKLPPHLQQCLPEFW